MAKKKSKKPAARGGLAWVAIVATVALVIGLSAVSGARSVRSESGGFSTEVTAQSPVRLNEVMASNGSTVMLGDGTLPDWVELYNSGNEPVDLTGYALMCGSDGMDLYRFQGTKIEAGGYLMIYCDGGEDRGGELHAPFKLSASGERLTLLNAAGAAVDTVETLGLESDWSYCRESEDTWAVSAQATPGEENQIAESQSAAAMKIQVEPDDVYVSEVMTGNATYFVEGTQEHPDYIELTNRSGSAVNLKGWYLSDRRDDLDRWTFPEVSIEAGGTLVVYCSGEDGASSNALYASFRLGGDGTDVVLTRPDGRTVSLVEVPALETDQAYSLVDEEWTTELGPTPGMSNTVENAGAVGDVLRAGSPVQVWISEIASASSTVPYDWIELYNAGAEAVDLTDYGLSDNADRPRKWQFPQGTVIQPGGYLAVFCSGLDATNGEQIHSNFKLSADGGYSVVLSQPDGTIIDRVFMPKQYEDITYGRAEGREGLFYFELSTPLAKNDGTPYLGRAQTPEYSVSGGLYQTGDTLSVELSAAPGARIYYTLDNTDPTEASTLYTGPISISGTTILRTRVYADGYLPSFMDTQSYLYDVNNGDGVYVVSLVSDPYNLNSEEAGIMIKGPNASATFPYQGANYWQDWEREAHVEIFGGDGEPVISQGCGIKLHGQYSRAENQQAFKVIARTKYGNNRFEAPLFSNRDYQEYQSFVLRSSGQDTDKVRMRDSVLTALAADTSVMYQETEICVLYLDGVYWGQYNIRERINTYSICQFEGWEGQEDDIDLVKANDNTMQGSNETFEALLEWVKQTDPTTDQFYAGLDSAIDIRNYIEYMAIEIFVGNGDTLNVKRYRNANDDGKWRWVLFDLDWAFVVDTNSINRWLEPGGMGTNLYTDNTLFIACMKNPRFRDEFLTYMGEQMATTFTTENVLRLFQERYAILEPLLPDQFERWGQTPKQYQSELNELIQYAQERPTKLLQYFMGYGVSDSNITLTQEEMLHYFGDALEIIQNGAA